MTEVVICTVNKIIICLHDYKYLYIAILLIIPQLMEFGFVIILESTGTQRFGLGKSLCLETFQFLSNVYETCYT